MSYLARTSDGCLWIAESDEYVPLSAADPSLTGIREALRTAAAGALPSLDDATAARIPAGNLSFDRPVPADRKLWGIGLNYADHATDLDERRPDEPASFLQPASSVTGPDGPIRLPEPSISDRVTAEAELGVVIGRTCTDLDENDVDDVVAGYVPLIDVTAEDILEQNPRFLTRAKSFDTFLVYGSRLYVPDEDESIDEIRVTTERNGTSIASAPVSDMLFSPRELVAFHSRVATLEPGDIINTGTPGAVVISPGDTVRAVIDRVGRVGAAVVR